MAPHHRMHVVMTGVAIRCQQPAILEFLERFVEGKNCTC